MAATLKNNNGVVGGPVIVGLVTKLPRGKNTLLGVIVAANDAVAFTVPEPTRDNQGVLAIMMVGGTAPTGALEVSLDGGVTWAVITLPTVVTTAAFGDTATTGTFYPITVSGLGSGAIFRFGRTDAGGGNTSVWALVG